MGTDGPNGEGHVDEFDESEEIDEDDRVVLVDEEGNEHVFVELAVFDFEDRMYAMLSPEDQVTADEEGELEIFLFTYDDTDDGAIYGEIEDEETYKRVQEYCSANLLDTGDEDED